MNRYAVLVIVPVLLHLHLRISAAGATVALSLPWVIPVVLSAAVVLLAWACWRNLHGFRSSPYPRPVSNWST